MARLMLCRPAKIAFRTCWTSRKELQTAANRHFPLRVEAMRLVKAPGESIHGQTTTLCYQRHIVAQKSRRSLADTYARWLPQIPLNPWVREPATGTL